MQMSWRKSRKVGRFRIMMSSFDNGCCVSLEEYLPLWGGGGSFLLFSLPESDCHHDHINTPPCRVCSVDFCHINMPLVCLYLLRWHCDPSGLSAWLILCDIDHIDIPACVSTSATARRSFQCVYICVDTAKEVLPAEREPWTDDMAITSPWVLFWLGWSYRKGRNRLL